MVKRFHLITGQHQTNTINLKQRALFEVVPFWDSESPYPTMFNLILERLWQQSEERFEFRLGRLESLGQFALLDV